MTDNGRKKPCADTQTPALIEAYRAGDDKAFEGLYKIHAPTLTRYIASYYYWHDQDQASDVVQHAFMVAADGLKRPPDAPGGFRGDAHFYTWLSRIANNKAKMIHQHDVTTAHFYADSIEFATEGDAPQSLTEEVMTHKLDTVAGWVRPPEDPADIVARHKFMQTVQDFLDKSSQKDPYYARGIAYMERLMDEDITNREIAEHID